MRVMKPEKQLDAVTLMREARDRLSAKFRDMSFEDQKRYVRKQLKASRDSSKRD